MKSTTFTKIDAQARTLLVSGYFCESCIRRSATPRKARLFEVLPEQLRTVTAMPKITCLK